MVNVTQLSVCAPQPPRVSLRVCDCLQAKPKNQLTLLNCWRVGLTFGERYSNVGSCTATLTRLR